MTPNARHLYVAGLGLGLVGSLATAAGLIRSGAAATGVLALGPTVALVLALRNVRSREGFDLAPTLAYRVGNWGGAVLVVALGLAMLAIGLASLGAGW